MNDMRHEIDDMELRNLLKANQPKAGRNEWFTRKVMNRLPERHTSLGWLQPTIFAVCFVICALAWGYLILTQNFQVILVKDLIAFGTLLLATIVLLWQFMQALFQSE